MKNMETIQKIEKQAPLEELIHDRLLGWIKQNYASGDQQLPSEAELARNFGVSRATIRAALSLLSTQGIIIRKHGSGTYVNRAMLRLRLETGDIWEFEDMIRRNGHTPEIRFIDARIIPAGKNGAALGLDPGEEVLQIRKIFTADGKPAIYSIDLLSLKLVQPSYDPEKVKGPIFPFLQESCGETPSYCVTDIFPIIAGKEISQLLEVDPTSSLLFFKDLFYNSLNIPIMYADNYFTDLIHFRAIQQPRLGWW